MYNPLRDGQGFKSQQQQTGTRVSKLVTVYLIYILYDVLGQCECESAQGC